MTLKGQCFFEFTLIYRLSEIYKKDPSCSEEVTKTCLECTALCPCPPCCASSFPLPFPEKSFTFVESNFAYHLLQ